MPVAGQFRDFPLADAVNAVRHATGTFQLSALPGVGGIDLDLHDGVITACRTAAGQEMSTRVTDIAEMLLIAHGATEGEWAFHPTAAPRPPRCHVSLDAAMLEMLRRADEIEAEAATFRPPSFRLRWKGSDAMNLPEDLREFVERARPALEGAFGARASTLAEELGLAVPRVQYFLARLERAGWVEPAAAPPAETVEKPAGPRFQAGPPHVKWFYREGTEELGPVEEEVIIRRIEQGLQLPQEPVWCQGLARWVPYEEIKARDALTPPRPASNIVSLPAIKLAPPACAVCGGHFAPAQLALVGAEWLCAACREQIFPGTVPESERVLATVTEPASRWRRAVAWVLDTALFLLVAENIRILLADRGAPGTDDLQTLIPLALLGFIAWQTAFVVLGGATPAKWALGLRVVRRRDARFAPGFFAALGRSLGSLLPFGWVPLLLPGQRATFHDQLASTQVIRDR